MIDEHTGEDYTYNAVPDADGSNGSAIIRFDDNIEQMTAKIKAISAELQSKSRYSSAKTTLFSEQVGEQFLWIGGLINTIPPRFDEESQKMLDAYDQMLMKVIPISSRRSARETLKIFASGDIDAMMLRCSARQPMQIFLQELRPRLGSYDWPCPVHIKIVAGSGRLVNLEIVEVLLPITIDAEGQ